MADRVCAQIWKRQTRGHVNSQLTFVELRLEVLQALARRFDPLGERFTSILNHDPREGQWDDFAVEDEKSSGNIYRLLRELYFLRVKTRDDREQDEIQRWIWTCHQALRSDLPTFSLQWADPSKLI